MRGAAFWSMHAHHLPRPVRFRSGLPRVTTPMAPAPWATKRAHRCWQMCLTVTGRPCRCLWRCCLRLWQPRRWRACCGRRMLHEGTGRAWCRHPPPRPGERALLPVLRFGSRPRHASTSTTFRRGRARSRRFMPVVPNRFGVRYPSRCTRSCPSVYMRACSPTPLLWGTAQLWIIVVSVALCRSGWHCWYVPISRDGTAVHVLLPSLCSFVFVCVCLCSFAWSPWSPSSSICSTPIPVLCCAVLCCAVLCCPDICCGAAADVHRVSLRRSGVGPSSPVAWTCAACPCHTRARWRCSQTRGRGADGSLHCARLDDCAPSREGSRCPQHMGLGGCVCVAWAACSRGGAAHLPLYVHTPSCSVYVTPALLVRHQQCLIQRVIPAVGMCVVCWFARSFVRSFRCWLSVAGCCWARLGSARLGGNRWRPCVASDRRQAQGGGTTQVCCDSRVDSVLPPVPKSHRVPVPLSCAMQNGCCRLHPAGGGATGVWHPVAVCSRRHVAWCNRLRVPCHNRTFF